MPLRYFPLLALFLLTAACASSGPLTIAGQAVEVAAAQQIEGPIADDFGMPLVATCPIVDQPGVGSEFLCTATTSAGELIEFAAVVASADRVDVSSTNVVTSTVVDEVRSQLATDLSNSTGYDVAVDCPDEMVTMILPTITCTAVAAAQPAESPIDITFTNARTGSYRVDLTKLSLFNPSTVAAEIIATDMAAIVGVPLVGKCPDQIDATVGTEFRCTADTPDGRSITFMGTVDRLRHIDMQTSNFLREGVVQAFESSAADVLSADTLTDTIVDCQPRPVLFNELGEIRCDLFLGSSDQVRIALITIKNFSTLQFTVAIETPEPEPEIPEAEAGADTEADTETETQTAEDPASDESEPEAPDPATDASETDEPAIDEESGGA